MRIRTTSGLFAILLGIAGATFPSARVFSAPPDSPPAITEQNWERHPGILEIRELYNDIQSGLQNKTLRYREKNYSRLPRSCRGTYPLEYVAVATDSARRVRAYIVAQRISHDDLLTTRKYYDQSGHLRFVYRTNESRGFATIENRVYLTGQGAIMWDVKSEGSKREFGEIARNPSEIGDLTTEGLLADFDSRKVGCADEQH